MHVIVATDGSRQSLTAAKQAKAMLDASSVTDVSVVAVVRPLAAVAFADELSGTVQGRSEDSTFRQAAQDAVGAVAAVFDGWGPKVHKRIRSGSPANELIKAAKQLEAGLIVVGAGSRGLSDVVLLGSTAQRVQQYAPCPVLVVRPAPRRRPKKS